MAENVKTPEFRASYANVFRPGKAMNEGEEGKYGIVMLFRKGEDLSALKKAVHDAVVEKWGTDKAKWPKNIRMPFRDQAEREKDGKLPAGHEAGAIFVSASSKQKPGLVDKHVNPITDETEFYSGCWARATVRAFAYDTKGNRGVAFGLQNIQKIRDDEPLGGRRRAEDDFEPLAGSEEDGEMPTSAEDLFR